MNYSDAKKLLKMNFCDVLAQGLLDDHAKAREVVRHHDFQAEQNAFSSLPETTKMAMRVASEQAEKGDRGYAPDWGDSPLDFEQKAQHKQSLDTHYSIR